MMRAAILVAFCAACVGSERWGYWKPEPDSEWVTAPSELECYRALAAYREQERRAGRSADVFAINCVRRAQ